ncbi:unnamed protein product [Adineta steineri]|uniref:G-protein coupled receptors family 1 profile domain-containing protein n=1 Tax=Adineta steineri TaxID=433720 RepID=A0A814HDB8_9BILA|nr:unnamed protein product [Adineta steineri]CAF3767374.1 unnamed protein product [Adineta steineri]
MYLIPIILLRRFHTTTNILTGNYCIASVVCCGFWILFDGITEYYFTTFSESYIACMVLGYFRLMVNCLLVYSLTMITINRYFTIKYPTKILFKRKTWSIVSSIIPWIVAVVLCMPTIIFSLHNCGSIYSTTLFLSFYSLSVVVIVPSIVNIIFNSLIFMSVRSSTRRINALATTTTTATTTKTSVTNTTHQDKRDIYLLKHIVFMFIVFISGWAPVYTFFIVVDFANPIGLWLTLLLQFLPALSLLISIIDLFLYNHELRQYLKDRFLHLL